MDQQKVQEVIEVLNRIHEKDPTVLPALINYRVPCNNILSEDPTVQVGMNADGGWEVGLLGILNGVCGVNASDIGYIAARFEKVGKMDKGVYKAEGLIGFEWQDAQQTNIP